MTRVNAPDAEIFGSGVREHQSRHGGVGLHHAVFGEPHAYLREGQKAIERINVAFSRAKRLLIVVGDKDFFARNSDYRTSIQAMEVIGINQLS